MKTWKDFEDQGMALPSHKKGKSKVHTGSVRQKQKVVGAKAQGKVIASTEGKGFKKMLMDKIKEKTGQIIELEEEVMALRVVLEMGDE